MAPQEIYQPPPLEDILRTLSRFSSAPVSDQSTISTTQETPGTRLNISNSSIPADLRSRSPSRGLTTQQNLVSTAPQTLPIDPSTITSWPQALKYVVSNLSQSSTVGPRIKTLIHSQHRHEKQWWTGRETLIAKQKGRDERKKRADDLLRSLGSQAGAAETSTDGDSIAEAEQDELRTYDGKVYQRLSEMSRAMDGELRGLGVPFFAIRHDLVDLEAPKENVMRQGVRASSTDRLRRDELVALQKQMLELLEALFGD